MDNNIILYNTKDLSKETKKTFADLAKLTSTIERDKVDLDTDLKIIEETKAPLELDRNFFGVTTSDSIEKTINSVHKQLSDYIRKCGKILRSTNENLTQSLKLIEAIVGIEKDLYDRVDFQSMSNEDIIQSIKEICKEQGIHNESVEDLLTKSMSRAYTLRDRLNYIKEELEKQIEECNIKIEEQTKQIEMLATSLKNQKQKDNKTDSAEEGLRISSAYSPFWNSTFYRIIIGIFALLGFVLHFII